MAGRAGGAGHRPGLRRGLHRPHGIGLPRSSRRRSPCHGVSIHHHLSSLSPPLPTRLSRHCRSCLLGAFVVVFACHGALWSWGLPVWALCFQAPTHCTKTAAKAAEMPALFRQPASCWGRLGAPLPVGGAGGKPCRLHSFHRSGSNFSVFFSKG